MEHIVYANKFLEEKGGLSVCLAEKEQNKPGQNMIDFPANKCEQSSQRNSLHSHYFPAIPQSKISRK